MNIFNTIMAGLVAGSLLVAPASAFSKLPDNVVIQVENDPFFYEKSVDDSLWSVYGVARKNENMACTMERNFGTFAIMLAKDLNDGEIFVRIKNLAWNFTNSESMSVLVAFSKDGEVTQPVEIGAIPVSPNELILPNLSINFVSDWMYKTEFGLMLKENKHLTLVDLTGTVLSMKYMVDCIKIAPIGRKI